MDFQVVVFDGKETGAAYHSLFPFQFHVLPVDDVATWRDLDGTFVGLGAQDAHVHVVVIPVIAFETAFFRCF